MFSYMSLFPLMYFLYILIPLGPIVYLFIRWRSIKGEKVDPNLGIKVLVYYFKTLAYHLILIGISLLFAGLLKNGYTSNAKIGTAFIIAGGLVYAIHYAVIQKAFNETEFPLTRRVYNAFNLILVGLIGLSSSIIWISIVLSKRPKGYEAPLAFLAVYLIAWICQSWTFYKPALKK